MLEVRPDLTGVACSAASHLASFQLPNNVQTVFIATEAGKAGRSAAARLAEQCEERGIRAIVAEPPWGKKDWNDALAELGPERTKEAVEQALAPVLVQALRPDAREFKPPADAPEPSSD